MPKIIDRILNLLSLMVIVTPVVACSSVKKKEVLAQAIYKAVTIESKKDKVWSALTDEKELSLWWNKGVRIEPRIGGEFYEPWGEDQLATGKVLEVRPQQNIKFTWHEKYWDPGRETVCVFTLKEVDGSTTLKVSHSGWETFEDIKYRNELINGFKKGWDLILPKIKGYLEKKSSRSN